jgi:hypothetical protein
LEISAACFCAIGEATEGAAVPDPDPTGHSDGRKDGGCGLADAAFSSATVNVRPAPTPGDSGLVERDTDGTLTGGLPVNALNCADNSVIKFRAFWCSSRNTRQKLINTN